jgi:hypothetical protein
MERGRIHKIFEVLVELLMEGRELVAEVPGEIEDAKELE